MEEKKKGLEAVVGEIEGHFPQKFVVGLRDNKLTYVAHELSGNIGYHREIARKFGIRPIGGGWVTYKEGLLSFCRDSGDYGGVPESILKRFELENAYNEKYSASQFEYRTDCYNHAKWEAYKEGEK